MDKLSHPFNYVVDPYTRKNQNIELDDCDFRIMDNKREFEYCYYLGLWNDEFDIMKWESSMGHRSNGVFTESYQMDLTELIDDFTTVDFRIIL